QNSSQIQEQQKKQQGSKKLIEKEEDKQEERYSKHYWRNCASDEELCAQSATEDAVLESITLLLAIVLIKGETSKNLNIITESL
ncbi:1060_t:CDS:2, partial [Ambispora leptoticha]